MAELVYLNGRILSAEEAHLSPFDAGFVHAAGLFETLRAYYGKIMRLEDHLDRLLRSAATLEMQIQCSKDDLSRAVYELLAESKLSDARIRLTVTPGPVPRLDPGADAPIRPTVFITAGPVRPYPADLYSHGMRVCICPYKQNRFDPLAGHKTLAYMPRLMAMKDAAERKCNESLWFTTDNLLAEGSICNVFIIQDGVVATPSVDTPILPGTVRKAAIELAKESGIKVEERAIDINSLLGAPEVFLTGSVLEIMPVTSIEKHVVGDGRPGEIVQRLMKMYRELVAMECGA